MTANDPKAQMLAHLKEALRLADQCELADVAIRIDAAIAHVDMDDVFLRDSAARIWSIPD